jgi:serine protease Do
MASFDPIDHFDLHEPPPRPTTPPVRRGFLVVFAVLSTAAALVYGVPYVAGRVGYAYESGRAQAAMEALSKLDESGVLARTSTLFRLASTTVAPAVVHISVYRPIPPGMAPNTPAALNGLRPGLIRTGTGSGVVIDKTQGFIVTNNHVVQGAESLGVRFGRGDEVEAQLVGTDPKTDLAVLRVPSPLRAEARWGDSDKLDIGDWVLAIGSPFELDQTVTAGIVSATGRSNLRIVGFDSYEDFIQTDAAINPGNSGGPLINLKGEVVGINAAILSETGGNQGIGLAISSALARRVVDSLIREGRVVRGYLGVVIADLNRVEARERNLPDGQGVLIREVEPDSPADRAGLRPGDVVVRLNDQPVEDVASLRNQTASLPINQEVPLTFYRDGQPSEVRVRIEALPVRLILGFHVQQIGPPLTQRLPDQPERALLISRVLPGGAADRAGLRPGMRILGVGDRPVDTQEGFDAAVAALDLNRGIPLQIQAPDGRPRTLLVGGPSGPSR